MLVDDFYFRSSKTGKDSVRKHQIRYHYTIMTQTQLNKQSTILQKMGICQIKKKKLLTQDSKLMVSNLK